MAPHDERQQKSHEIMLQLRNIVHFRLEKPKDITLPKRDKQGFRKRRPKLAVALGLGVVAVLSAVIRVIIKNADRG